MAACKSVVVLCPNARRQTVKVGPTTTILQILEEVCKKQGLSSQENAIKHQKKILDETLPIRYSGLSNNAHLEIVPQKKTTKIDAQCTIALQLASGQRLMKDFPPAHSLWDVIQHWNSQQDSPHHQKLLGEEGKDVVCVYLTQRISGEHTLKSTTLHSLGLTGKRAIIRLLHEEATSSNPKPLVSEPAGSSSQHQETLSEPCQIPATVTIPGSMDTAPSSSQEGLSEPCQSPATMTIPGNMDTAPSTSQEGLSEPCQTPATVTIPGNMDTAPSTIHEGLSEPCQIPALHDTKSQGQPSKVDKPTEDRHRQLDTKTVSPDRAARDPKRTRIAGPDPIFPDFKFPDRSATDVSNPQAPIVTEERLHYLATPCERCPVVFKENDETIAVPNQDVPDSFYDVTVEDIRKMLHNLQSERTKSGDMPLLTKAMRESRKLQEICKYERVVIRVKFPDRLILQGFFRPQEKVSVLTEFVKSHLEDPNESFYLYTAPPKTVLQKQDDTLYDAQLCPASFVHFGSKENKDHFLASQLLGNLATALDAEKTVLGSGICGSSAPSTTEPSTIQTATNINTSTNNKNTKTTSNGATVPPPVATSGKVPKWFKAQ